MNLALKSSASKVFPVFFASLIVAFAGLLIGQFTPPAAWIPIVVVEFALLFAVIFLRKRRSLGYPLMYAFVFVSGLTLFPALAHYVSVLGADIVVKAFGITAVAYGGIALYAVKTKEDFSFLGGFLFAGLLALLGVGIVGIFFPMSGTVELVYSAGGILIFIGYTLYDFNKIARRGISEDEIPIVVIELYLDFINLFLHILRFMSGNAKK